jgi:hypothetical protein
MYLDNDSYVDVTMESAFSGNIDQARRLMDKAWLPGYPGKKEWADLFWKSLPDHPYWREIEQLRRIKADAPPRDSLSRLPCYWAESG